MLLLVRHLHRLLGQAHRLQLRQKLGSGTQGFLTRARLTIWICGRSAHFMGVNVNKQPPWHLGLSTGEIASNLLSLSRSLSLYLPALSFSSFLSPQLNSS